MRNDLKILDCTLRDGGYYTNWQFDQPMVELLIKSLNECGVDIIELGYKSPIKGGKYRKCNDEFIRSILPLELKSKLAFMIDAKDFNSNGSIDHSLIDNIVKCSNKTPFDICRLAIKFDELNLSDGIINRFKDAGYGVTVNLMAISTLTDDQINVAIKCISNFHIDILYLADSYGNLIPDNVVKLVTRFKDCGKPIGIHTHNNMGLAFANALSAIDAGAEYIDCTLLGMGRGAGNAHTEQLVHFLSNHNYRYNSRKLRSVISKYMVPLSNYYKWGFSSGYMLSGMMNVHPLYCQHLQASNLNPDIIEDIVMELKGRHQFDESNISNHLIQKVAVIIPARFKSTRFPGKPLAKINNKPMVIIVAEIAEKAVGKEHVYIATENDEIVEVVTQYGYNVVMTSDNCMTGTDRVAEASYEIDADIIVNIQGDEPLVDYHDILKVIEEKKKFPKHVINCMARLNNHEDVTDPKIPKVVININNELMYASRTAIPSTKYGPGINPYKQVCIYAFNKDQLMKFVSVKEKTPLEWNEDIEIIRFVELGIPVKMLEVNNRSIAVDYPGDIAVVERIMNGT